MGNDVRQADGSVVVDDTDSADGRDCAVEQEFAVINVDLSRERAFEEFHQGKCGGNDHLEDVVGGVDEQIPGRCLELEHTSEEGCCCDEEVRQIVASGILA